MASLGLGYYGSWLTVVDTITTDQQNLNLWTYISTRAASRFNWNRNGGKKLRGIITINSGVNIYSNNPLTPAITIPADSESTFRSYDQVIIINKGSILGAAGIGALGGGSTAGFDGGKGGTAIYTRRNLIITNNGNIYGGGGGGGGGGGAYKTEVLTSSTNCPGASYCDKCCILNCQGRNYCSTPNDCTVGVTCGSSCQYYTNASDCNGSTVGTCNTKYRECTTYTGGKGGNGQGYGSVPTSGTTGIIYGASIFTGSGGDGGAWGQDGEDGIAGSTTSFGNGGQGGCWIDGSEFTTIQTNNDERGYQCTSSGSGTLPVLWSGWSSQPSITTTPPDGSGVTISTQSTDLYIEPRQALTTIIVNSPNNLGGAIDLSNSRLLQTMTCNTQSIASLNLTNCSSLKTLNFNSNNLSTLNVSHCISLETLNLENNNIRGNLSGLSNISLTQNTTRTISIKNNNMSATNLNDIFNQLPQKPPSITPEWSIYVDNNTGTCSCNWVTAKNKDWRVYPTLYSLTSNVDTTNEGTTVNFILDSTLLGDGTVPYTITGITPADINGASLTGNFTLYKGSGMVSFTITNDVLQEGEETMTLTIDSVTCPTSKSVVINDTSTPFMANIVIASNTNNYNGVNTFLTSNGWNGVTKVNLIITVNSGVTVGSTSETTAALTIPTLPSGSVVTLTNNGNIYGAGGSGGSGTTGDGANGSDGGTAISSGTPITLNNYGNIKGGGGGGGGGAGYTEQVNCNPVSSKVKSGSCCECSSGCTSPQPGYQYFECDGSANCYYDGCAQGGDWRQFCWSYNIVTTYSTCTNTYTGGTGGKGKGSGNVAATGTSGTSGRSGGNGGDFGTDGTDGGDYNVNNTGGTKGLAGYYLLTSSGATYVINAQSGSSVAGRVG